jgi:hypothetical protein
MVSLVLIKYIISIVKKIEILFCVKRRTCSDDDEEEADCVTKEDDEYEYEYEYEYDKETDYMEKIMYQFQNKVM